MRHCPDCDHVEHLDANPDLGQCPVCQADAPATGWPDDGAPQPGREAWTVERRLGDHRYTGRTRDGHALLVVFGHEGAPPTAAHFDALVAAAEHDVAGVVDVGTTPASPPTVWTAIEQPEQTLAAWLKARSTDPKPRLDAREAASVALAVARALRRLAQVPALTLDTLSPDTIAIVQPDDAALRVVLLAVEPVRAIVHGQRTEYSSARTPDRWDAPDVADGDRPTPPDAIYGLGLLLYTLLAGSHPLSGLGLRERLRRQSAGEIAPLPDDVARELPPGLQSLVLSMLAPRRDDRPAVDDVVAALEDFAVGRLGISATTLSLSPSPGGRGEQVSADFRASTVGGGEQVSAAFRGPVPSQTGGDVREADRGGGGGELQPTTVPPRQGGMSPRGDRGAAGKLAVAALVLVSAGLLVWALTQSASGPSDASAAAREIIDADKSERPMHVASSPEECAQCHPNQVLEWERSVMAHSARSPLFNSLDMLIQEQVGRSFDCPGGAGILRKAEGGTVCREPSSGVSITGAGGEHWCVNCHAPLERRLGGMAAWNGFSSFGLARAPVTSQVSPTVVEGITCTFCHQVTGPATGRGGQDGYVGNQTWRSFETGRVFDSRPEARLGLEGIGNSGYYHDPTYMFDNRLHPESSARVHGDADPAAAAYLESSEFCGTCHDVRLFGTDVLGAEQRGEHFKRLRNAYSEWRDWADMRRATGQEVSSCQDCHMSLFPGVCDPQGSGGEAHGCPPGTGFVAMEPGAQARGGAASSSDPRASRSVHYFSGVDVPLTPSFDERWSDDATLDVSGVPIGAVQRRDLLLKNTFELAVGEPGAGPSFDGRTLSVPIVIENTGAGHRVPAGFSQEREVWMHVRITDAAGRLVYEVGRVDDGSEDLRDKVFTRVNTDPDLVDGQGRPVGLFGADVVDGPDVPRWFPPPELGTATRFRGRGLVNFQNGFLRCVTCLGTVKLDGSCEAPPGLEQPRSARFTDGEYDQDTGACISNLRDHHRFLEVWFPVGALDASRGLVKGPDAIIDTRSIPPEVPMTYVYEVPAAGFQAPFTVEASLNFRAFPPFLIKAFAGYEAIQAARGRRPDGPLITLEALDKLEVVELERVVVTVP